MAFAFNLAPLRLKFSIAVSKASFPFAVAVNPEVAANSVTTPCDRTTRWPGTVARVVTMSGDTVDLAAGPTRTAAWEDTGLRQLLQRSTPPSSTLVPALLCLINPQLQISMRSSIVVDLARTLTVATVADRHFGEDPVHPHIGV